MNNSTVVCLRFPVANEPACLPGPANQGLPLNGRIRPRVSRDGDTVTVCAARWEWEVLIWVLGALKDGADA